MRPLGGTLGHGGGRDEAQARRTVRENGCQLDSGQTSSHDRDRRIWLSPEGVSKGESARLIGDSIRVATTGHPLGNCTRPDGVDQAVVGQLSAVGEMNGLRCGIDARGDPADSLDGGVHQILQRNAGARPGSRHHAVQPNAFDEVLVRADQPH